jgi:hypothetical protein
MDLDDVGTAGPRGPHFTHAFESLDEVGRAWRDCLLLPTSQTALGQRWFIVPLWLLFVICVVPTAWAWRGRGRRGVNACATCGYALTGNVTGRCPECGEPK